MEATKPWYASSGVWGGIMAGLAGVAGLAGYQITPGDQASLANGAVQAAQAAFSIASLIGGAIAILGRVRASKAIAPAKS